MTSDDRWQEIERLYHLARQQDPERRETFLEKACEGNDMDRYLRGRRDNYLLIRSR